MDNLFSKIVKTLPKPSDAQLAELKALDAQQTNLPVTELSTKDLVSRWQSTGNGEDTKELLKRLQPTINSAITSYAGGDKSLDVKAAKLTLEALKKYDPSFGADPSTFVFHNLKRLNRIAGKRGNIIPQSEYAVAERNTVQNYINNFVEEYGREPSLGELADKTGLSPKKLDRILSTNVILNDTSTLAEETGASTVGSSGTTDDDYFEYVYASVSPIDQKIMEWASGYHKKPILSNNQIATKLRISPAAVSQRKAKIQQLMSDVRGLA